MRAALLALVLLATPALAQEEPTFLPYKNGESWPGRNFEGVDFLEPFFPATAASRGDAGRIVLNSGLPYALLASSFAIDRNTDLAVSREIARWEGLSLDPKLDTYGVTFTIIFASMATILLPAPEDQFGYSWQLRLDRLTVFTLGCCIPALLREATAPIYNVPRPDGSHYTSQNDARPSGHTAAVFAAAAFASNTLRDWLRPEEEKNVLARVGEEALLALPYLPPVYVILERIKTRKHTLVDCLTGAFMGAFTMQLFYSWSFDRRELGRSWLESLDLAYDPDQHGYYLALSGKF